MRDYNHWTILGLLCELLPQPDNRVTLADERDQYRDADRQLLATRCARTTSATSPSATKTIEQIWEHAGAQDQLKIDRFAHLVGGARMGFTPEDSVVDANHRVWEVPNLFVVDGSVLPDPGSREPGAGDHGARRSLRAAAEAQAGGRVTEPAPISDVKACAYTIPTDAPEADGTLAWDSTTLVVATARAAGMTGLGWTYGHAAIAQLIETELAKAVHGRDAIDVQACWAAMVRAIRNEGRPGLSSMAIAAVDVALWDLKAKLLGVPLERAAGPPSPDSADLRQRRLHLLLR